MNDPQSSADRSSDLPASTMIGAAAVGAARRRAKGRQRHRALQAAAADRRRRVRHRLHGRAGKAGPPHRRDQDHQAGHGYGPGDRSLRVGAAGPGPDGSPKYRPGLDAGATRSGPSLLRDGAGQRGADHRVLRQEPSRRPKRGSSCFSTSATPFSTRTTKEIIHRDIKPSNVMVTLHDGVPGREGHRLRRGQGDRAEADREDAVYRLSARCSARRLT